MTLVRNTGFVISLVILASLVCHVAIKQQFERHSRSIAKTAEVASVQSGLRFSSSDDDQFGSHARRRYGAGAPRFPHIVPAVQIQTDDGDDLSGQIGEATTVPAPVDNVPAETGETEESSPSSESTSAVREVIERELSHTTREERDIWFDELKTLPAGVVRDLLQVRKQLRALPRLLGGMPEKLASTDLTVTVRSREIAAEPASQKIRFNLPDYFASSAALETAISQLRHNLTNAATPGFKRLRVTMVDSYSSSAQEPVNAAESMHESIARGEGCRVAPLQLDLKQGALKKTGRQLDLAIDGVGFFVVKRGERVLLTRCGAFALDRERQLCLVVGDDRVLVQPPVTIPDNAGEIQVSGDGTVTFLKTGESDLTSVGRLQLATVPSPTCLQPIGQTLFAANEESGAFTTGSPMTDGFGNIQQGCLEQSNVDLPSELGEIEELTSILTSLPLPNTRPITASGPRHVSPR